MTSEPKISDLTPSQRRIMLVLCEAADAVFETSRGTSALEHKSTAVRLRNRPAKSSDAPIRESTTGAALVRKGLAVRLRSGAFSATAEGYWLGDALRVEDRLGRVPPRRS